MWDTLNGIEPERKVIFKPSFDASCARLNNDRVRRVMALDEALTLGL